VEARDGPGRRVVARRTEGGALAFFNHPSSEITSEDSSESSRLPTCKARVGHYIHTASPAGVGLSLSRVGFDPVDPPFCRHTTSNSLASTRSRAERRLSLGTPKDRFPGMKPRPWKKRVRTLPVGTAMDRRRRQARYASRIKEVSRVG